MTKGLSMRTGLRLAGLAGILPLAIAASASAGTGWRDTATRGIALKGTPLGALAGSTPMRVAVALKLRQPIASGTRLTPAEFDAAYAPTTADAQAVASYLRSAGLTGVAIEPNRL